MGCRQCNGAEAAELIVTDGQKLDADFLLRAQNKQNEDNISPQKCWKADNNNADALDRSMPNPINTSTNPSNQVTSRTQLHKNSKGSDQQFRPRSSALEQQEVISITSARRNQQLQQLPLPRRGASESIPMVHYTAEEFHEADMKHIEQMLNKKIKTVKGAVLLPSYIAAQPLTDRDSKLYIIELTKLPVECSTLPNWWVYVGQWDAGLPRGIGKIYHKDFTYEGYVEKGVPHLYGRYVTLEDVYEGQINMNVREGFGRLVTKSHYFYEGEWRQGLRSGNGFEIHKSGIVFEGTYENNQVRNGNLYMPKGDVKKLLESIDSRQYVQRVKNRWRQKYSGEFREHKFHGEGTYIWADKRTYSGQWSNGKMNGHGRFSWPNGKQFEGSYSNNRKHGYGVFVSGNKQYHGEWSEGLPHGCGKLVKGNITQEHHWRHGKIVNGEGDHDAGSMISGYEQERIDKEGETIKIPFC